MSRPDDGRAAGGAVHVTNQEPGAKRQRTTAGCLVVGFLVLPLLAFFGAYKFGVMGVEERRTRAEHAVVWGTFTGDRCVPDKTDLARCVWHGTWTSDDGRHTFTDVFLDGGLGDERKARAATYLGGERGYPNVKAVHTPFWFGLGGWAVWGFAAACAAVGLLLLWPLWLMIKALSSSGHQGNRPEINQHDERPGNASGGHWVRPMR